MASADGPLARHTGSSGGGRGSSITDRGRRSISSSGNSFSLPRRISASLQQQLPSSLPSQQQMPQHYGQAPPPHSGSRRFPPASSSAMNSSGLGLRIQAASNSSHYAASSLSPVSSSQIGLGLGASLGMPPSGQQHRSNLHNDTFMPGSMEGLESPTQAQSLAGRDKDKTSYSGGTGVGSSSLDSRALWSPTMSTASAAAPAPTSPAITPSVRNGHPASAPLRSARNVSQERGLVNESSMKDLITSSSEGYSDYDET
jgi:hypothetical protein